MVWMQFCTSRTGCPWRTLPSEFAPCFADGGYAGPKLQDVLADVGNWTIQIVKRADTAKEWEKSIESSKAWILIAHIRTLTRRIASHCIHA
jgi:transposase